MKTGREETDIMDGERNLKRQKLLEKSSSPPPPMGFENPLLPLANTYDDDDEDEDYERRARSWRGEGQNGARVEQNSNGFEYAEVEDDNDDQSGREFPAKHNRQVEVRRDCPYLDTVNRQVCSFS